MDKLKNLVVNKVKVEDVNFGICLVDPQSETEVILSFKTNSKNPQIIDFAINQEKQINDFYHSLVSKSKLMTYQFGGGSNGLL